MEQLNAYKDILTIIVPVVTTALGVHAWFYARIESVRKEGDQAHSELHVRLDEALDERRKLSTDIAQFREQVARENVTTAMLEKFENRLILSVDKLGDRLDKFFHPSNTTPTK